jgi:hypothetical protein
MKGENKNLTITYHVICAVLLLASLCYSILGRQAVVQRTWQAIKDFGASCAYYGFGWLDAIGAIEGNPINTGVQLIPANMETLLPVTLEEGKRFLETFAKLLVSKNNIASYLGKVGDVIGIISVTLTFCLLPFLILFFVVYLFYKDVDNEHGKLSKGTKIWFKIEDVTIIPAIYFLKRFIKFFTVKGKRILYIVGFCVIWGFNLNLFTIVFEGFAWILWFSWAANLGNLLVQIAKFAVDISVVFTTLPTWMLVIGGFVLFDLYRRNEGIERLKSDEEDNKEFLKDHPGNLIATGKPRVGKTKTITDMALSQNVIFREIAKGKSEDRKMEFPFFPWQVLEQTIIQMRKCMPDFGLETLRGFIAEMQEVFERKSEMTKEERRKYLAHFRARGYIGHDFIFNYDYKRHGLIYNNNLTYVSLWQTVRYFAEEFAIYTSPTPLIIGNYPIRTSIRWKTFGNSPIMKADFFKIKPYELLQATSWNHIVPHDALRLGVKEDPNGEYNNAFDSGCLVLSEIGKELGNQITNRGKNKDKDSATSNANNDLWTANAKIMSHGLTVDYECYFRIFGDEQRAMSVLADFRELGSEMRILKKHAETIKMPFFAFEELAFILAKGWMKKIFEFFDSRHGSMTLIYYFILRLYQLIFNHYTRIRNQFGSYRVDLKIKDESQGEDDKDSRKCRYMISRKKTCADIYNTTFFNPIYREKFKKSKVGGREKIPQFTGLDVTIPQMKFQRSHFNKDLFERFDLDDMDM